MRRWSGVDQAGVGQAGVGQAWEDGQAWVRQRWLVVNQVVAR